LLFTFGAEVSADARPLKLLDILGSFRQNTVGPPDTSGSFRQNITFVVAGHSRPKDGVAALACVPAIHAFLYRKQGVDARDKRGHDGGE